MSRFEKAIHFVIANTEPDELGRTKLAKVLFFADLDTFKRTGRSLTGATYEKRQFGPMPRDLYGAIDRLAGGGKIAQRKAEFWGREQHQFWALERPDLKGLTADDVATLGAYTRAVCENHTAASISDLTHNAAWECAATGEPIPLAAFLAVTMQGSATASEMTQIEAALRV